MLNVMNIFIKPIKRTDQSWKKNIFCLAPDVNGDSTTVVQRGVERVKYLKQYKTDRDRTSMDFQLKTGVRTVWVLSVFVQQFSSF